MERSWEALEADFQRFYSLDLAALVWGSPPPSWRRLIVLVRGLPADARFHAEHGWTRSDELAALQIEAVMAHATISLKAAGSKKSIPPFRFPRPWDKHRGNEQERKMRHRATQMAGPGAMQINTLGALMAWKGDKSDG